MAQPFSYKKLSDPGFFEENRLEAHSDHVTAKTEEEAFDGKSSYRLTLDGVWKFYYSSCLSDIPAGFEDPSFDCRGWEDIRVPANMETEGYGRPQYCNTQYPWDGVEDIRWPQIPERNPVGNYVRCFTLPEGFLQSGLFIRFDGVSSAMALWLNGAYVGYGSDSFGPKEFDLTPYLTDGENKLAVQVFKYNCGSWMEDQDFIRLSGIFRSVTLFTRPSPDVTDIRTSQSFSVDFKSVDLAVHLRTRGTGSVSLRLFREMMDPETLRVSRTGGAIAQKTLDLPWPGGADTGKNAAGSTSQNEDPGLVSGVCDEMLHVNAPALWSAEAPNLYVLVIELRDESGRTVGFICQEIGFRKFAIGADHIMRLNGQRIIFNGTNRHEFSSRSGRALTEQEMLTDVLNMKRMNINALRTSHYPNSSAMYRLCDRLGIYVIDENNLETHGTWDACMRGVQGEEYVLPGDHMEWEGMVIDRGRSMLERDKNHPCVLIWSCGNESYGGKVIYDLSQWFRAHDSRPVHYEGVCRDRRYNDTSDIESRMYAPAAEIRDYLREHRDKPFILCEYAHSMGNSNGAVDKYTALLDEDVLYQGGFIWDYIDQCMVQKDRYGREYCGYGGDFDDRPSDYDFCGNGIAFGDDERTPTPKGQIFRYLYQPFRIEIDPEKKRVTIRNRHLFTDASAFLCRTQSEEAGRVLVHHEGRVSIGPQQEKTFSFDQLGIKLPEVLPDDTELTVTVSFLLCRDTAWAKAGQETAFGQAVVRGTGTDRNRLLQSGIFTRFPESSLTVLRDRPCTIVRGNTNVGVIGENFSVLFEGLQGALTSYVYAGREMLKAPLRPNFWRAPTQNDIANGMMQHQGQWKLASLYASTKIDVNTEYEHFRPAVPMKVTEENGRVQVEFTYRLPTVPESECRLGYEVYGDGTVTGTLTYEPVEGLPDMPEFGVMGKMDADYGELAWYGFGPEETYPDRMAGARLGVWRRSVTSQLTPYLVPQEAGAHAGTRMAAVTDKRGRGLLFFSDSPDGMAFSALPWTPHEIECAAHGFELPPVHYTVFRLNLMQMGVGGDNTWGAYTHPEFHLPADKPLRFEFGFRGI